MKLTLSQLRKLTTGALSVTQDANGICFARYAPSQVAAFAAADPVLGDRANNTTGVRIDFHTDAAAVTVEVASAGKYEVLIDNLTAFVQRFEGPDNFTVSLEGGEKRVTLVMPSHDTGRISSVTLEGASCVKPHKYSKKLAFYGDSITQGWDSAKDSQSFAWLVTRYYDADSMIWGVGGSRFQPDTVEDVGFDADAVIVALGTNDIGAGLSLDEVRANCAAYLDRIAAIYGDRKRFCITPIWRADKLALKDIGLLDLDDVRQIVRDEAQLRDMIVIDGLGMIPHRSEYFADAFLHPNDTGFAMYALNLLKILNQYL